LCQIAVSRESNATNAACILAQKISEKQENKQILYWREKMHNASTAAGCAEIRNFRKTGCFIHFSETGDSPDMFIF